MEKITGVRYILSENEYEALTNPDKCYTLLTKTKARKAVKNILKQFNEVCWNDDPEEDDESGCCSYCSVMRVLGSEAGEVMCDRHKRWSK